MSELFERKRQVDRDGGLADAAFAAGNGDEVFHARNGLAFGHRLRCWAWWHGFRLLLEKIEARFRAAVLKTSHALRRRGISCTLGPRSEEHTSELQSRLH